MATTRRRMLHDTAPAGDTMLDTASQAYDTTDHRQRHGRGTTTTRRQCEPRHGPARGLGVVHTQCAHSQGPLGVHPVHLTRFDLVHCFQSLFGPLFMSTVHEVFKKNKK